MTSRPPAPLAPASFAASSAGPSVAAQWNALALDCISRIRPAPPAATRALATLHTSMYNAWAAYDDAARQAAAMGHAAQLVLARMFPSCAGACDSLAGKLAQAAARGPDRTDGPLNPAGIGRTQAASMLETRGAGDETPFAAQVGRLAAEWAGRQPAALAEGADAAALLSRLCRPAPRVSGHDGDVLLLFALSNALDDAVRAAGAGAADAAAAEVLRRFTGGPGQAGTPAPHAAWGRQVGSLVFDKARRYWLGKL